MVFKTGKGITGEGIDELPSLQMFTVGQLEMPTAKQQLQGINHNQVE